MTSTTADLSMVPAQRDGRRKRLFGIGLMCTALACLSCLDSSSKWLSIHHIPLVQLIFVRYFVAFVLIALLFNPIHTRHPWATPKLWLQTLRALALLGSTVSNFMAFRTMPLADIIAINFCLPLVIAILAGPILGERIGPKQWLAITLGFAGVLVVAQPGTGGFDPGILWCFGSVASNTFYQLATRRLSGIASTASMMLISTGLATAMIAPMVPAVWISPSSIIEWSMLLLPGAFGALGHYLLVRAYALAPAPIIAPFSYTQIAWTSLLGLFVFGEIPGVNTALGSGIVICSGLYLIYLETRGQRSPPDTFPAPAE